MLEPFLQLPAWPLLFSETPANRESCLNIGSLEKDKRQTEGQREKRSATCRKERSSFPEGSTDHSSGMGPGKAVGREVKSK